MYPIRFENLYFNKIWGGRDFEKFRDNLPKGNIGESWDIACHQNGNGIVANGNFKGMKFSELIEKYSNEIFGDTIINYEFPLLVKLINSNEYLSVQVHPNDEYARNYENSRGKTEAWYVMEADEGAELIVGTNGCTKEEFIEAIKSNTIETCLNRIKVKKGDAFLINSGLIHAIGPGLIVAEIQENSDITYRVYDYGRPREIHVEKSLDVINFDLKAKRLLEDYEEFNGYKYSKLCRNKYFSIDKYIIDNCYEGKSDKDAFQIITCVEGEGTIEGNDYREVINKGDSFLLPATLGVYKIKGNLELLLSKYS